MTAEHKAKLLAANLGHHRSAETRAKLSLAASNRSPETRAKMSAAHIGHFVSEETRAKHSNISAETREALAAAQRGHVMPETTRLAIHNARVGSHTSDETKAKQSATKMGHSVSLEARAKISAAAKQRIGPLNPCWRGGVTSEGLRIRGSSDYAQWRSAVFARDGFVCQKCGDDRGGNLKAHHMDCFADFPEKRLDVNNGITLCVSCHIELHRRYGVRHNRKWQTDEFLAEEA